MVSRLPEEVWERTSVRPSQECIATEDKTRGLQLTLRDASKESLYRPTPPTPHNAPSCVWAPLPFPPQASDTY